MKLFTRFARDASGATSIEYALIGSLVSIAIVIGAAALGTQLNIVYTGLSEHFGE